MKKKIYPLIVVCDPSVVRISVSNRVNYFILIYIFLNSGLKGGGGVRTPLTLLLDPPLFESTDEILKCDHSFQSNEKYVPSKLFIFQFLQRGNSRKFGKFLFCHFLLIG